MLPVLFESRTEIAWWMLKPVTFSGNFPWTAMSVLEDIQRDHRFLHPDCQQSLLTCSHHIIVQSFLKLSHRVARSSNYLRMAAGVCQVPLSSTDDAIWFQQRCLHEFHLVCRIYHRAVEMPLPGCIRFNLVFNSTLFWTDRGQVSAIHAFTPIKGHPVR